MRITRKRALPDQPVQQPVDLSLVDAVIEKYRTKKGNIIPLLQKTQELFGYLPATALEKLAVEANIPLSNLYGVATFYAQFRLHPVGKHIIKVCHGTACHVQNSEALTESLSEFLHIQDGETTKDGLFTLESVACLGCCSLAPVMMVKGQTYGKLTGDEAVKIIKKIKAEEV